MLLFSRECLAGEVAAMICVGHFQLVVAMKQFNFTPSLGW